MKHITIITALLMTFATQAVAVSGSMSCKVKTSYVVAIEDGIAETFKGYSNGAGVGETVTLSYTANGLKEFIMQVGQPHEKKVSMYPVWANIKPSDVGYRGGSGQRNNIMEVGFNKLVVSTDTLEITSPLSYASFQRYYKNDWHGYVRTESSLNDIFEVHLATLNCRHNNDQLDEFINAMKRAY